MSDFLKKERETLDAMISLYCRDHHHTPEDRLCDSCRELADYAMARLEKCPYGEEKPACSDCPVHCYKPARREEIRNVMRYAGPRIMRSHPLLAIRHLARSLKKPPKGKP